MCKHKILCFAIQKKYMATQGCSEKETSGKMGTKQLISSARQCTCTLAVGGQKVPCQAQCDSFGA
jgi:hypothetical protein